MRLGGKGRRDSHLRYFLSALLCFPRVLFIFATALGVCTLLLRWESNGMECDGVDLLRCHVRDGGGGDAELGEGGGRMRNWEGGRGGKSFKKRMTHTLQQISSLAQVRACGKTSKLCDDWAGRDAATALG